VRGSEAEGTSAGQDVALVTGVAGDIGLEAAILLADRGLRVVGWDRAAPTNTGPKTHESCEVDLAIESAVEAAAAHLRSLGPLRYVVHTAGGASIDELRESDPAQVSFEAFTRAIANNLYSSFLVMRYTVPELRKTAGDRS
jgi:NAD(P)-dependent dehydrogenase (short-subunit alcohol dehydrogenase family)